MTAQKSWKATFQGRRFIISISADKFQCTKIIRFLLVERLSLARPRISSNDTGTFSCYIFLLSVILSPSDGWILDQKIAFPEAETYYYSAVWGDFGVVIFPGFSSYAQI